MVQELVYMHDKWDSTVIGGWASLRGRSSRQSLGNPGCALGSDAGVCAHVCMHACAHVSGVHTTCTQPLSASRIEL